MTSKSPQLSCKRIFTKSIGRQDDGLIGFSLDLLQDFNKEFKNPPVGCCAAPIFGEHRRVRRRSRRSRSLKEEHREQVVIAGAKPSRRCHHQYSMKSLVLRTVVYEGFKKNYQCQLTPTAPCSFTPSEAPCPARHAPPPCCRFLAEGTPPLCLDAPSLPVDPGRARCPPKYRGRTKPCIFRLVYWQSLIRVNFTSGGSEHTGDHR
jgi:hypothetical protein